MLVQRIKKLQERAVCLINFESDPNVVGQLPKDSNILKLTDFIIYKYALFIRNSLRKENIPIFNEFYTLYNQNHVYNTGLSCLFTETVHRDYSLIINI